MTTSCFCSGACRLSGVCPVTGHRVAAPFEVGRTYREPLTEERVRKIVREELDRAKAKEHA